MKAEELRIGNLVMSHGTIDTIVGVDDTTYGSAIVSLEKYGNGETEIEPIPLTEEWLLNFGFDNDEISYHKRVELLVGDIVSMFLFKTYKGYGLSISTLDNQIGYFEYVHQLQNLYFALTGIELTLTK